MTVTGCSSKNIAFSFTNEVNVLQPVNGFYEVIPVTVDGELLTFRANCYSLRQKKGKTTREALNLIQENRDEPRQVA